MSSVLTDVYSFVRLAAIEWASDEERVVGLREVGGLLSNIVVCEEVLLDREQADDWGLNDVVGRGPIAYAPKAMPEQRPRKIDSYTSAMMDQAAQSMSRRERWRLRAAYGHYGYRPGEPAFLGRAKQYLALSQELGVYLALHPERHAWLASIALSADDQPLSRRLLQRIDRQILSASAANWLGADVDLPPVADYIVRLANRSGESVLETALGLRETRRAAAYRASLRDIAAVIREGGRGALREAQALEREVHELAGPWAKDLDEGVRYKTRTLSLRRIPLLGAVLEGAGFGGVSVRDPILGRGNEGLLFINDLYRHGAS